MIEIQGLVKRYGQTNVLDGVTVTFGQGQIHGLIGRNGSGKTMLIKCICALVRPTQGSIVVGGKPLKEGQPPQDIGAIVETPGFLPYYSGQRNLRLLAGIRGKIGKEEVRQAIRRVGLDPDSRKWVGRYSLGMRQRLGLAQAIMENPGILILDEPMNGLDNQGVEDMRQLFLQFKAEGKTILLASHNREDIETLCDHVYTMDKGRLTFVW